MKQDNFENIKLIASDMDHTLLTEEGKLPPDFSGYVTALQEKGIRFVIASGRPMYTLQSMFEEMKDQLVFMSDNGGAIAYQGKLIYKNLMRVEDYQEMIRFVEDQTEGASVLCGMDGAFILRKYQKYERFFGTFLSKLTFVDDMRSLDADANKFSVFFPDKSAVRQLHTVFEPRFADRFTVTVGGDEWIDLMNPGVTKGSAMKQLGNIFGIDTADMMAFGDTYNDIEMLQTVAHSYVVENADSKMRQYAHFVAPGNQEYGVLKIMDQVLAAR